MLILTLKLSIFKQEIVFLNHLKNDLEEIELNKQFGEMSHQTCYSPFEPYEIIIYFIETLGIDFHSDFI